MSPYNDFGKKNIHQNKEIQLSIIGGTNYEIKDIGWLTLKASLLNSLSPPIRFRFKPNEKSHVENFVNVVSHKFEISIGTVRKALIEFIKGLKKRNLNGSEIKRQKRKKEVFISKDFQGALESFREWLQILGYAPSTVYQLPNYIRDFFTFLENKNIQQLWQIENTHFKAHFEHLKSRANIRREGGLSNAYLNKYLQAYYKFLEYLKQSGKLNVPSLDMQREEPNSKPINILSTEEIKILFESSDKHQGSDIEKAFSARDKAMLCVYYSCGLRRSEGHYLNLGDIHFDQQILHVRRGKNHSERFVVFNNSTAQLLKFYVCAYRPFFQIEKEDKAFFLSLRGQRMKGQSLSLRLKKLQQRSNDYRFQQKEVTLHTLRHSIASHLLHAGMSLQNIARFLGHNSLESTQIYTHLGKKKQGCFI